MPEDSRSLKVKVTIDGKAVESEAKKIADKVDKAFSSQTRSARYALRAQSASAQIARNQEQILANQKLLERGAYRWADALRKAQQESQAIRQLSYDIGNIGRNLAFMGGAVVGTFALAARQYADFAAQSDVAARSLSLNSELTQELRENIVGLSTDLALLSPEETAQGVTIWAQATDQVVDSSEDLQKVLEQTTPLIELAALTQEDLGTVTDGAAAALSQFGLDLGETEKVVAIFNKVADDTLASVGDVAQAFTFIGPQAASMGINLEEASSVLAVMAQQGIRGSRAGRAFARSLTSIVEPSEEVVELWERGFGTDSPFYNAEGQFVGYAKMIDMIADLTEDMTDAQRDNILAMMFTQNALPGVTALVNAQTEARKEGINVIEEGTIALTDSLGEWEQKLNSWNESDIKRLRQAEKRWEAFWLGIGSAALEVALPALDWVGERLADITEFANTPLGKAAVGIVLGAGGLAAVAGIALTSVAGAMRVYQAGKDIIAAFTTALTQEEAAALEFNSQVLLAANEFHAIIVAAATEAAGIEVAGAATETSVEVSGAATEGMADFVSGLRAVAVPAAAGAGVLAKLGGVLAPIAQMGSTVAIAAAIDSLRILFDADPKAVQAWSAEVDQMQESAEDSVGFVKTFRENQLIAAKELEGAAKLLGIIPVDMSTSVAGVASEINSRLIQMSGDFDSYLNAVEAYNASLLQGEEPIKAVGVALFQGSKQASTFVSALLDLVDTTAEGTDVVKERTPIENNYGKLIQDTSEAIEDAAQAHEDYLATLDRITQTYLSQMASNLESYLNDMADMSARHAQELADLEESFRETDTDDWSDYYRRLAEMQRDFATQQQRAAEDHAISMRRLQEDSRGRQLNAIRARDALALRKERQDLAKRLQREGEDYNLEQRRRQEDHARNLADLKVAQEREARERAVNYQRRLRELRLQHEKEKEDREAEFEARRIAIEDQRQQELRDLDLHHIEVLNQNKLFNSDVEEENARHQMHMYNSTVAWWGAQANVANAYLAQLQSAVQQSYYPQPRPGAPGKPYLQGGYVNESGPAYLHAPEFILGKATTAALERNIGTLSQQKLLGLAGRGAFGGFSGGTPAINQSFSFAGSLTEAERSEYRRIAEEASWDALSEFSRRVR